MNLGRIIDGFDSHGHRTRITGTLGVGDQVFDNNRAVIFDVITVFSWRKQQPVKVVPSNCNRAWLKNRSIGEAEYATHFGNNKANRQVGGQIIGITNQDCPAEQGKRSPVALVLGQGN